MGMDASAGNVAGPALAHVNAFTILMQFTQPKGERLND